MERAETKVAANMDAWNAKVAQLKHEISAKQAEQHAEWLEWEASFAIDYAEAAIEEAKSAVLDAIVARIEAEKSQGQLTQPSILPAGHFSGACTPNTSASLVLGGCPCCGTYRWFRFILASYF